MTIINNKNKAIKKFYKIIIILRFQKLTERKFLLLKVFKKISKKNPKNKLKILSKIMSKNIFFYFNNLKN